MRVTILDLVAEGDKVAKHWTFSGTHKGEFGGIPPTGKQVTLELALSIYRFTEGKIAEIWMSYNALLMMQQLGKSPHWSRSTPSRYPYDDITFLESLIDSTKKC
jgi:hypothetical protein